jgi:hypothetical protein
MNNYYTAPTDNKTPSYQQASMSNVPNYDAYVGGYMKRLQESGISLSFNNEDSSKPYKVDNYATGEVDISPSNTGNNQYQNQSNSYMETNYPLLAKSMAMSYLNKTPKSSDSSNHTCTNCQEG